MKITEVSAALVTHYRAHRAAQGGHKTVAKGKYGFKSIQYKVAEPDGTIHGPFLGRGAALTAYRNEIKLKGKPLVGVKFLVENIFVPRRKEKGIQIDGCITFEVTA